MTSNSLMAMQSSSAIFLSTSSDWSDKGEVKHLRNLERPEKSNKFGRRNQWRSLTPNWYASRLVYSIVSTEDSMNITVQYYHLQIRGANLHALMVPKILEGLVYARCDNHLQTSSVRHPEMGRLWMQYRWGSRRSDQARVQFFWIHILVACRDGI